MYMKKQKMFICVMLVLGIMLSACGKQPRAETSSSVITTHENASSTATASHTQPIKLEYEYVGAVLEDNKLYITILPKDYLGEYVKVQYNVPYTVSGLDGTYTDLFIGTIGQDTCPYAFLLTANGTVECVPIDEQIYKSEHDFAQSADTFFESIGVLPGLTDVVSFKEGNVYSDDGSGYVTVFAECSDGTSCDLRYPILFIEEPDETPASIDESIKMLAGNDETALLLSQGMSAWFTGEFQYLYGEYGRLFSLGTNREQQIARKWLYGVCASGAIYSYNTFSKEWAPANHLAALYGASNTYSDLFAIITDPHDAVYQQYIDTASLINTPLVGLETSMPLLMPLKTNMHLKVEMMADTSGDYDAEVDDTFFDGTVTRKTPYFIAVPLSEKKSVLRVTASWYDGFDDIVAVWYATYYQGRALYTQYVKGVYIDEILYSTTDG